MVEGDPELEDPEQDDAEERQDECELDCRLPLLAADVPSPGGHGRTPPIFDATSAK